MPNIKCTGCFILRREEIEATSGLIISYFCPRFYPQAYYLAGIISPGKRLLEAIEKCPEEPLKHCILCDESKKLKHYGDNIVVSCFKHYDAWGEWLNEHPEKRAYLAPLGRHRKANWIDVFRAFVEDMRKIRRPA